MSKRVDSATVARENDREELVEAMGTLRDLVSAQSENVHARYASAQQKPDKFLSVVWNTALSECCDSH